MEDARPAPTQRGGCLCDGVRYAVERPLRDVFACHCRRCQKTSGNFVAATAAAEAAITFERADTLLWFHPADDPHVAYGFCARCGSSLFWRVIDEPTISIMAGTLDGPTGLRTTEVWFADEAADHVTLDPTTPRHSSRPPTNTR